MKTTFIYLGILVTMVINSAFAIGLTNEKNVQENNASEVVFVTKSNDAKLKKPALELESDTIKTWLANSKKTIEEVIAEDNQIIESDSDSNAYSAIYEILDEIIKIDNQIIESTITKEVFPLDMDSIDKTISKMNKEKHQNSFPRKSSLKS